MTAALAVLDHPLDTLVVGVHVDGDRHRDGLDGAVFGRGVDPDQLVARGYGESEPVASNDTPAGRERNRRVELRIIKR